MFKKALAAAAVATALINTPAIAADTTSTFSVGLALTPQCQFMGTSGSAVGGAIDALNMTYTSFQTSASTGSTSFKLRCTNSQAYTIAIDTGSVSDATSGLNYTMNLSSSSTHASGTNTSLSGSGAGYTQATFYVHGTIAADQAGNANGSTSNTRTLTISY